jgi:hypothetical protein
MSNALQRSVKAFSQDPYRMIRARVGLPPGCLFWSGYFRGITNAYDKADTKSAQVASGGCCQWVLDAIREIVEWPSQPLRFESVVLRTALDISNSRNPVAPLL